MAAQNRTTLKYQFRTDQPATEAKFADLIDSFKLVQTPVSSPSSSGQALEFISTISQNAEGVISATKKSVNLNGYQTNDIQVTYRETVRPGDVKAYTHKKDHYPTVRVLDNTNTEISPLEFKVTHSSINEVKVTFANVAGNVTVVLD